MENPFQKIFIWIGKIFTDSLTKTIVNILTILLTALLTFFLTIGIASISYGLNKNIEVPIYLLLIIFLFSLLGIIPIIDSILELIFMKKKNASQINSNNIKRIIIHDPNAELRDWLFDLEFKNHSWRILNEGIYCKNHNLKLQPMPAELDGYKESCVISMCIECEQKVDIHCLISEREWYFESIKNMAIREASKT